MDLREKIFEKCCKSGDDRLIAAKIVDKYIFALKNRSFAATSFLTPPEQSLALKFLPLLTEARHSFLGGADGGRRILYFYCGDFDLKQGEEFLRAVSVKCPRELSHRDYLGSVLGLGIRRESIGDIAVREGGCHMAVLSEIAPFIKGELKKVGRENVSEIQILPISSMDLIAADYSESRATVPSMRLDAVISAGFNIPRSRSAEHIRAGKASVNYEECKKPDFTVKDGDRISVSGLGRIIVESDGRTTRRGRIAITVKK